MLLVVILHFFLEMFSVMRCFLILCVNQIDHLSALLFNESQQERRNQLKRTDEIIKTVLYHNELNHPKSNSQRKTKTIQQNHIGSIPSADMRKIHWLINYIFHFKNWIELISRFWWHDWNFLEFLAQFGEVSRNVLFNLLAWKKNTFIVSTLF